MGYGSWFNVRLMNCEIFIFTYSLSFWDPVSFFLMMGEVGGGGGAARGGLSVFVRLLKTPTKH